MNNIIKRKWNKNAMVNIEDLRGMAFQAESGGHTFQISGIDGDGNPVALSGTPSGVMLRSDNQDVALTCSISNGKVNATLPANAYSVSGRFGITIFLTSDGQKTAIYAAAGTVVKTSSGTVAPPAGSDVVDLVNAIAAAVATIPASYTDMMAAMAPTYSSSGLYAVGSYAWYNGKLYRCTTPITSGETWTSGHWTLANLGSDLVDLKSALDYNRDTECDNVDALGKMESTGVLTLKWKDGGIDHSNGTTLDSYTPPRLYDENYYLVNDLVSITNNSSKTLYITFYSYSNGSYTWIQTTSKAAGSTYTFLRNNLYVRFDILTTLDDATKISCISTKYPIVAFIENLNINSIQYKGYKTSAVNLNDLENGTIWYIQNTSSINLPVATSGFAITIPDKSYVGLQLYLTAKTANNEIYMRRKTSSGGWASWSNLKNPYVGELTNNSSLDSLGFGTVYFKPSDLTITNDPCPTKSGLVYTNGDPAYVGQQIIITTSPSGNTIYVRRHLTSGWGSSWENVIPEIPESRKEISILFVGNSLTQDGIAYLPYLLKNYFPEVSFKFYMWYNGGYTLVEQYAAFNNNTPAAIFSVAENSASWTNYNSSKTMASVLSSYEFDVVCLQGYYNYTTNTDDETAYNNCRNYIQANYTGGNPLEFISLFHAPKRDDAATIFERTKLYNGRILQNTISQDMLPIGIAVYRALSTDLDSLGDEGHLSPDGTHTQEGLPCLLQTYTALCWLLDKLAISKSVYGFPFKMTTAIYNTINVPGPNLGTGVIDGTDAQNLLAQEVAIKAFKEGKSFVNKNIYVEPST